MRKSTDCPYEIYIYSTLSRTEHYFISIVAIIVLVLLKKVHYFVMVAGFLIFYLHTVVYHQ